MSAAHAGVPAWPSHADVDHHDDAQAEAELQQQRQPREQPVSCPLCRRNAPRTWNPSGLCDRHQAQP
jgi:hypothetical protein